MYNRISVWEDEEYDLHRIKKNLRRIQHWIRVQKDVEKLAYLRDIRDGLASLYEHIKESRSSCLREWSDEEIEELLGV